MQVKGVPDFISTVKDDLFYAFDKNGRFIYVMKETSSCPIFILYDIFYNDYIELTPDSSVLNFVSDESPYLRVAKFLPIDFDRILIILRETNTKSSILLINMNMKDKSYGILNEMPIAKRWIPRSCLCDGEMFGVFLKSHDEINNYAFLSFTIEENYIKPKRIKKLNYVPYSDLCHPLGLYLHQNKLWFIRRHDAAWPMHSRYRNNSSTTTRPQDDKNFRISYFDLNVKFPAEINVGEIILNHLTEPEIIHLKWIEDSLIVQLNTSKFNVFNLKNYKWIIEMMDCGLTFKREGSISHSIYTRFQELGTWPGDDYWECDKAINIDDKYVLLVVYQEAKQLRLIPLRNPLKLQDIAWLSVLNAGYFNRNSKQCLPKNLLYTRAF